MDYSGKLYWDGETPRIQAKDKLIEWLKTFPVDSWYEMDLRLIGKENNTDQSKLYHKWCDILASEYGWDSGNEMHEYLKDVYNGGQSTKGMDTHQWSEFMNKVLAFAGEHDIILPTGKS